MACCSSAPRVRKPKQFEMEQYARESCVAERVTELISPMSSAARGWDRHLPVVIVPGMCSSGLKVLESADQPSWENDRLWLSMQKLSANQVVGSRVGTMEQTHGATLTVVIERAQQLMAGDANGTSDPYSKVALLDAAGELVSRVWHTSVKPKTLSPEWEEDFLIGTRENIDTASVCLVEVMDKDIGGSDDLLGKLEFPMPNIMAGDYAEPAWHKLEQRSGSGIEAQGSLRMSVRYEPAPSTPAEPPKEPPPPQVDDMFSKLSTQEALDACDDLGIMVTEGETTLVNMQAAIRAHFANSNERNPRAVFAEIDTDNSGVLDREEVERATAMLGFLFNREQASEAFAEMDANDDNEISVKEFEAWWERQLLMQKVDAEALDPTRRKEVNASALACPWAERAAAARKKLLGSSAWVRHMCLAEDGKSDPIGIKVRAFRGLPGVAYLQAGVMSPFTWVFAKVIDHLKANGYEANKNLMACPYDWRLALQWQEERDGYFSKLKQTIEDAKAINSGKPAILLAHSMGNRTVHYFLNWILNTQRDAQQWLDEHVHSFFAVAAPFLGASSAFRGAMLGEDFGIGAFINQDLATILCRSCSAGPEVFPVGPLATTDRLSGCDVAYSRHEGRLTIDVLSADLTSAVGSPLAMQIHVEHSQLKNRKRHSRSKKTRNNFVDGSEGSHGRVDFYQRFQFTTEDVDVRRAVGEDLTFHLRVDKATVAKFSLPVSDWFIESKAGTLHVGGLGEQYKRSASLRELFQRYGPVAAVTLRQKVDQDNSSWALITFKEESIADQVLNDVASLRAEGLVVTRFDLTRRTHSMGNLGRTLQKHREKLQGTRGLSRTYSSSQTCRSERRRRDSRVMGGAHQPSQPSDELYDLDLERLTELFKNNAATTWSRDRWENLQLQPFCFTGHDAIEWLKRWLFENDLPHTQADALHLGNRLMHDSVLEAVSSLGERGSPQKLAPLCQDHLYRLSTEDVSTAVTKLSKEGRGRMSLTLGTAHEAITPDKRVYVVGACGVIRRGRMGEKMWFDTTSTPGGDIVVSRQEFTAGCSRVGMTGGGSMEEAAAAKEARKVTLKTQLDGIRSGDVPAPGDNKQQGSAPGECGVEHTSGYGKIALRPNHAKERWTVETEMSLALRSRHPVTPDDSDTITVAIEWELVTAARENEVVEDACPFDELRGGSEEGAWRCLDEIEASTSHPKLHPDDDSLDATSEENKTVGYRTVRFENSSGICMAELHIVLTFEGAVTNEPKKLDEHCPHEYESRELHEMLTRHGAGNCVDIHESSHADPNGLMHGTLFKAPPCRRVFHTYGINLDTEVGYFFKHKNGVELMPSGPKSSCGVELDRHASMSDLNFKVKSGVIFETGTTRQIVNDTHIRASGDGTVPYTSLRYSEQWDSPTCRSEIVEIERSEHREILADSRFHAVLLEYLSETLVCYVLEGRDLTLPKGRAPSSYVVGTLCYAGGLSSEHQKTEIFQRQSQPLYKKVMVFGAGRAHLGGRVGSWSKGSGMNEGYERSDRQGLAAQTPGGAANDSVGGNSSSHPAVGVQFQVYSSRSKPLADEHLGTVYVALEDILTSPTRAVQAWYTLVEPSDRGGRAMKLRLHLELEEPGQSYRGRGEQQAIAAVLAQDPLALKALP